MILIPPEGVTIDPTTTTPDSLRALTLQLLTEQDRHYEHCMRTLDAFGEAMEARARERGSR